MQDAVRHHRAGRLGPAATLYRQALHGDPDNVALLLTLGTVLMQQGGFREARQFLQRAVALQPGNGDAWMALGSAHARADALADADSAFSRAVALQPSHAALHVNHGHVRRRLGKPADAVASYLAALSLDPRLAPAQFGLGNALADQGALEQARDAFEAALAIDPGYVAARNNLGNLLSRLGRHDEALDCFEAVLSAAPGFPHVRCNLGIALQAAGRMRDAIDSFKLALRDAPDDLAALDNLCVAQLRIGDAREALAASERFLATSPANRKALAYKAAALLEVGQRDEAAALLDFNTLMSRETVAPPSGDASPGTFNAALARAILAHPTLQFEPAGKSTLGGSQTGELMEVQDRALSDLRACIVAAVQRHMDRLRRTLPAHPHTLGLPVRWRLATWAVVLRSQGHQAPHFHPDGAVSGVYYVDLPRSMDAGSGDAGWIEFGRTDEAFGGTQPPLLETVRPRPGLMLLFPSYFYHRTIPFEGREPRISVAFDVLPDD